MYRISSQTERSTSLYNKILFLENARYLSLRGSRRYSVEEVGKFISLTLSHV